jgi:proton-translocating NADH-quinone oxidoreductase chain L
MELGETLPLLLALAWLMPLASFVIIVLFGPRLGKAGVLAGYVATGAILISMVLSLISLAMWVSQHGFAEEHHAAAGSHAAAPADESHGQPAAADQAPTPAEHAAEPAYYAGDWYALGIFGPLKITIGYYIDALTVAMFVMVTIIATCIHFYANGYMHDELHDVTDHEVILSNGQHLHRKGRFHRFFQYMSLFSFSMLGLVIAGNVAMVFVFWELVGICSYFLIGFYIERHSASTAANKAFIVNRVGDFGMIVGMMILFGTLGTFAFGDLKTDAGVERGIFSLVRPAETNHALIVPNGMVKASAAQEIAAGVEPTDAQIATWRQQGYGYWLLVLAGLGIFCGCVGKSAQFPLHVWLPDAMEGPTPVSALVHSATMVAAGVYLVGRFYPVFAPEVLLTIAYIGAITLFLAATIAITATDIKRVLAYSTVSQLGYMMLALGVGGWLAGVLHLFTHAFFKSLLFLCSGSVIHACHTNELPKMGGLRHKMPWTAYTMLVGCLAIAGAGIPFVIGFSGYYSKDAILAQALSFANRPSNFLHTWLFYIAAAGAAITAFYMFRLWYMTFAGPPRDHHIYEHAHESPKVMYVPLVILAVFAVCVAWPFPGGASLQNLLETARSAGTAPGAADGLLLTRLVVPAEHESHAEAIHVQATLVASATALVGFILATMFYGLRTLSPEDVRRQFSPIHRWLINKWYFDELYHAVFVRPVLIFSGIVAATDRRLIDRLVDNLARWTRGLSDVDDLIDRYFVDGLVNLSANWLYSLAVSLRRLQTGQLRQYVMFIVVGTVAIFAVASLLLGFATAGG